MRTSDFDYNLPPELIAVAPNKKRDHSRLIVLDKNTGDTEHKKFFDIVDYFGTGDVLILNNSKVIPARLIGKKKENGRRIEVFLHKNKSIENKNTKSRTASRNTKSGTASREAQRAKWECIIGGKKICVGLEIVFDDSCLLATVKKNNNNDGTWLVEFSLAGEALMKEIEKIGHVPLPPYIKKEDTEDDRENYQTVYASDEKKGSVAAPTAGLHFTDELLEKLREKGIIIKYITLHVGMGTFASVKVDDIRDHKMHSEFAEISEEVIDEIREAKRNNKRVVTVGTTSTRTLEAFALEINSDLPLTPYPRAPSLSSRFTLSSRPGGGIYRDVDIFIYPGYDFCVVDAMITNFHLPKSSLIMLVSALAGRDSIMNAYAQAIKKRYRFYSYGDAMLIV